MTLFLTASSFYSIFTQVPKTFNITVALQVGFLKHLGDVATVLLDLVYFKLQKYITFIILLFQCIFDQINGDVFQKNDKNLTAPKLL